MTRPAVTRDAVWRAHYDLAVEAFVARRLTALEFHVRLAKLGFLAGDIEKEIAHHAPAQ
jgi:hypothetical protein